jgi:hypothetical protein
VQRMIESAEGAFRLNRSREAVVRLIQRGALRGTRKGRFWYCDVDDVERLARELGRKPRPRPSDAED